MIFTYLRNDSNARAHIWEGGDTTCGLVGPGYVPGDYASSEKRGGRPICRLCGDPEGLSDEYLKTVVEKGNESASRRAQLELDRRDAPWELESS